MADSALTLLENEGLSIVSTQGAAWFEDAVNAARVTLSKVPLKSPEIQNVVYMAQAALTKIESYRDDFAALGYQKTLAFLGRLGSGQVNEATAIFLLAYGGGRGGWADADQKIAAAGDATAQAKTDRDSAVAKVESIGSAAAKAALPLLLGAVFP